MADLRIEGERIAYGVRKSARARRLRLTVGPEGVEVVVPEKADPRDIDRLVKQHQDWIRQKLAAYQELMADHPGVEAIVDGARIPLRGVATPLSMVRVDRHRPRIVAGSPLVQDGLRLELPRNWSNSVCSDLAERTLIRWMKREAAVDLSAVVARYGRPFGLVPTAIRIKDQRRRWGSCTATGVINLNWRLIMAPPPVFDYVVVHELCHLRHRHHQPPFWAEVARVMPDFELHRQWLKTRGHLLTLTSRRA